MEELGELPKDMVTLEEFTINLSDAIHEENVILAFALMLSSDAEQIKRILHILDVE